MSDPNAEPTASLATRLRDLPGATWARAVPYSAVAGLAIGIPSDLIPNPLFGRPVPVGPIDYVIWAITAGLMGLIFAVRNDPADHDDTQPAVGGLLAFLAVGCPTCNQIVVALVGSSGALSWWAPAQPAVGLAAIALLVMALRKRLATYDIDACPLPATVTDETRSRR